MAAVSAGTDLVWEMPRHMRLVCDARSRLVSEPKPAHKLETEGRCLRKPLPTKNGLPVVFASLRCAIAESRMR